MLCFFCHHQAVGLALARQGRTTSHHVLYCSSSQLPKLLCSTKWDILLLYTYLLWLLPPGHCGLVFQDSLTSDYSLFSIPRVDHSHAMSGCRTPTVSQQLLKPVHCASQRLSGFWNDLQAMKLASPGSAGPLTTAPFASQAPRSLNLSLQSCQNFPSLQPPLMTIFFPDTVAWCSKTPWLMIVSCFQVPRVVQSQTLGLLSRWHLTTQLCKIWRENIVFLVWCLPVTPRELLFHQIPT
jgi:hypothetical protein